MHRAKPFDHCLNFLIATISTFQYWAATAIPGSVADLIAFAAGIYIAKYCFAARSKTLVMAFLLLFASNLIYPPNTMFALVPIALAMLSSDNEKYFNTFISLAIILVIHRLIYILRLAYGGLCCFYLSRLDRLSSHYQNTFISPKQLVSRALLFSLDDELRLSSIFQLSFRNFAMRLRLSRVSKANRKVLLVLSLIILILFHIVLLALGLGD